MPTSSAPRLFAIALACLSLGACNQPPSGPDASAVPVTTLTVRARQVPYRAEAVGSTEGSKEVEVRARVSGILEKQLYTEGRSVRAGAVLFRIDRTPYEIALDRARANLASEQAHSQQAHRNADRLHELLSQKLVSQNDVDTADSTLQAADAAVRVAQVNVREAELNLSYTDVVAPIGGITGRALRSEGALITANTDSSLLTTLTQADPIWVRFALSAAEHDALRAATKSADDLSVELIRNDGSTYEQQGRVNFAASTVAPNLGTVQLRAEFPNPAMKLLPGEYVRVRLNGGHQDAIAIPQTAVLQGAQGTFVWVVKQDNKVEQRAIKTGEWLGDDWRVLAGLQTGDVIALDNLQKLKADTSIKATPLAANATASGQGE